MLAAAAIAPTPSVFAPVSTPAFAIRELSFLVLAIVTVIFVIVAGLTVYAIVRYRRRPGDEGTEPPQVYGSTQIELAWTVVPFLIVIVLFLTTARYILPSSGMRCRRRRSRSPSWGTSGGGRSATRGWGS